MVKHLKEDIEGIRYCVIMRSGSSRFYVFEQWCDSLQEAQDCARVLADLSSQDADDDGESFDEYWAFDTKKWKAYLPADYYQDKYSFNYLFNPNIPIYRSDENGKAELFADYVGRKVNDYTGRWKKESYKKPVKEKYGDYGYKEITDERDLYYLDNIDDICKEQLPAYSRSLMIAAHNDDYDGVQHWSRAIFDLAQNLQELCGDLEELDESVKNPKKKGMKEHYSSSTDNRLIRDILWDIENSGDQRKIEKAFDLVHQYCDNIDEVFDGDTYNIDQAIWGFGTDYIIEELQWVRDEY